MHFEIVGRITDIEIIATGPSIRIRTVLRNDMGEDVGESWVVGLTDTLQLPEHFHLSQELC